MRSRPGDFSLATSRPNAIVRCVWTSDNLFHQFWKRVWDANKIPGNVPLPEIGKQYRVRANVIGTGLPAQLSRGVTLSHHPSGLALLSLTLNLNGGMSVELYYPYNWFNLVQNRP
jgi:hypothetical protein